MSFLDRHRPVIGLVLIACLALLGWWAVRSNDSVQPAPAQNRARVDNELEPMKIPASFDLASVSPPSADTAAQTAESNFGTLRGRVIDAATREPVVKFEVRFHGTQRTGAGDAAPGARVFAAVDGRFEWQDLPPGDWTVAVSAPGYQRFDLEGLEIPGDESARELLIPLVSGTQLRGRVYDELSGAGIGSASVEFRESREGRFEGNWRSRIRVTSAGDGSFVLDGVPRTRITLQVAAPDYASRELDVLVTDETPTLEIALGTGGTIAGRLTAADGITPIAGTVGLWDVERGFGGSSRTDAMGEFSYRHLSEGRYQLSGQTSAGAVTREIALARNQQVEGIVLALGAGHSIRGLVTGLPPGDVERLRIMLYRDADATNAFAEVGVDERGGYALHGVPAGRVRLVADVAMRRQLSRAVEMPADSDITVDIAFPAGARLSGQVTRAGKPLSDVRLNPRPTSEQPVFIYGTLTSKEGRYVIDDLGLGEYALWVGEYRAGTVDISGDTVFDIEVPAAQLSGRVLEQEGKVPIVGADVDMWPAEPGASRIRLHDRSNHFGRFAIAGLEPADFMLTVYKPGYEMLRKRISYRSPIADMTVRLRQEPGVAVSVRDADSRTPLREVVAIEMIGDGNGSRLHLQLDDAGTGQLPGALAGSTLTFSAFTYAPTVIRRWNGQKLDLELERQKSE